MPYVPLQAQVQIPASQALQAIQTRSSAGTARRRMLCSAT